MRKLMRLMAKQYGVVSLGQAGLLGFSPDWVKRRVRSGDWVRVHRGVYRSRSAPRTWHQDLMAASLWAGSGGVVSHRSAASLWRLSGITQCDPELIMSRNVRPPRGVHLHYSRSLTGADLVRLEGFVVTNATRVLIDLGSVVGREQHEEALDDALRRGLTSVPLLRERLEPLLGPGRLSTRQIRELIALRDISIALESPLEVRFLRLLKQRGLPVPISQFEVREGNLTLRIDFAYPDRKLAIECDGFQFHSGRVDWARDLKRRNFLTSRGWQVLHVTAEDIENPEAILQAIMKSLAA